MAERVFPCKVNDLVLEFLHAEFVSENVSIDKEPFVQITVRDRLRIDPSHQVLEAPQITFVGLNHDLS